MSSLRPDEWEVEQGDALDRVRKTGQRAFYVLSRMANNVEPTENHKWRLIRQLGQEMRAITFPCDRDTSLGATMGPVSEEEEEEDDGQRLPPEQQLLGDEDDQDEEPGAMDIDGWTEEEIFAACSVLIFETIRSRDPERRTVAIHLLLGLLRSSSSALRYVEEEHLRLILADALRLPMPGALAVELSRESAQANSSSPRGSRLGALHLASSLVRTFPQMMDRSHAIGRAVQCLNWRHSVAATRIQVTWKRYRHRHPELGGRLLPRAHSRISVMLELQAAVARQRWDWLCDSEGGGDLSAIHLRYLLRLLAELIELRTSPFEDDGGTDEDYEEEEEEDGEEDTGHKDLRLHRERNMVTMEQEGGLMLVPQLLLHLHIDVRRAASRLVRVFARVPWMRPTLLVYRLHVCLRSLLEAPGRSLDMAQQLALESMDIHSGEECGGEAPVMARSDYESGGHNDNYRTLERLQGDEHEQGKDEELATYHGDEDEADEADEAGSEANVETEPEVLSGIGADASTPRLEASLVSSMYPHPIRGTSGDGLDPTRPVDLSGATPQEERHVQWSKEPSFVSKEEDDCGEVEVEPPTPTDALPTKGWLVKPHSAPHASLPQLLESPREEGDTLLPGWPGADEVDALVVERDDGTLPATVDPAEDEASGWAELCVEDRWRSLELLDLLADGPADAIAAANAMLPAERDDVLLHHGQSDIPSSSRPLEPADTRLRDILSESKKRAIVGHGRLSRTAAMHRIRHRLYTLARVARKNGRDCLGLWARRGLQRATQRWGRGWSRIGAERPGEENGQSRLRYRAETRPTASAAKAAQTDDATPKGEYPESVRHSEAPVAIDGEGYWEVLVLELDGADVPVVEGQEATIAGTEVDAGGSCTSTMAIRGADEAFQLSVKDEKEKSAAQRSEHNHRSQGGRGEGTVEEDLFDAGEDADPAVMEGWKASQEVGRPGSLLRRLVQLISARDSTSRLGATLVLNKLAGTRRGDTGSSLWGDVEGIAPAHAKRWGDPPPLVEVQEVRDTNDGDTVHCSLFSAPVCELLTRRSRTLREMVNMMREAEPMLGTATYLLLRNLIAGFPDNRRHLLRAGIVHWFREICRLLPPSSFGFMLTLGVFVTLGIPEPAPPADDPEPVSVDTTQAEFRNSLGRWLLHLLAAPGAEDRTSVVTTALARLGVVGPLIRFLSGELDVPSIASKRQEHSTPARMAGPPIPEATEKEEEEGEEEEGEGGAQDAASDWIHLAGPSFAEFRLSQDERDLPSSENHQPGTAAQGGSMASLAAEGHGNETVESGDDGESGDEDDGESDEDDAESDEENALSHRREMRFLAALILERLAEEPSAHPHMVTPQALARLIGILQENDMEQKILSKQAADVSTEMEKQGSAPELDTPGLRHHPTQVLNWQTEEGSEFQRLSRDGTLLSMSTQAVCRTLHALARTSALTADVRRRVLRAIVALDGVPHLLALVRHSREVEAHARIDRARGIALDAVERAESAYRRADDLAYHSHAEDARHERLRGHELEASARQLVERLLTTMEARHDEYDSMLAALQLLGGLVPREPVVEDEEDSLAASSDVLGREGGSVASLQADAAAEFSAKRGGVKTVATVEGVTAARATTMPLQEQSSLADSVSRAVTEERTVRGTEESPEDAEMPEVTDESERWVLRHRALVSRVLEQVAPAVVELVHTTQSAAVRATAMWTLAQFTAFSREVTGRLVTEFGCVDVLAALVDLSSAVDVSPTESDRRHWQPHVVDCPAPTDGREDGELAPADSTLRRYLPNLLPWDPFLPIQVVSSTGVAHQPGSFFALVAGLCRSPEGKRELFRRGIIERCVDRFLRPTPADTAALGRDEAIRAEIAHMIARMAGRSWGDCGSVNELIGRQRAVVPVAPGAVIDPALLTPPLEDFLRSFQQAMGGRDAHAPALQRVAPQLRDQLLALSVPLDDLLEPTRREMASRAPEQDTLIGGVGMRVRPGWRTACVPVALLARLAAFGQSYRARYYAVLALANLAVDPLRFHRIVIAEGGIPAAAATVAGWKGPSPLLKAGIRLLDTVARNGEDVDRTTIVHTGAVPFLRHAAYDKDRQEREDWEGRTQKVHELAVSVLTALGERLVSTSDATAAQLKWQEEHAAADWIEHDITARKALLSGEPGAGLTSDNTDGSSHPRGAAGMWPGVSRVPPSWGGRPVSLPPLISSASRAQLPPLPPTTGNASSQWLPQQSRGGSRVESPAVWRRQKAPAPFNRRLQGRSQPTDGGSGSVSQTLLGQRPPSRSRFETAPERQKQQQEEEQQEVRSSHVKHQESTLSTAALAAMMQSERSAAMLDPVFGLSGSAHASQAERRAVDEERRKRAGTRSIEARDRLLGRAGKRQPPLDPRRLAGLTVGDPLTAEIPPKKKPSTD